MTKWKAIFVHNAISRQWKAVCSKGRKEKRGTRRYDVYRYQKRLFFAAIPVHEFAIVAREYVGRIERRV